MTKTAHPVAAENTLKRTWQNRLDRWMKSGLSKAAYCKAQEINYHQMIYWSRKLSTQTHSKSGANSSTKSTATTGFIAVTAPLQNTAQGISVRLPNGIEIFGVEEHNVAPIITQIIGQGVER